MFIKLDAYWCANAANKEISIQILTLKIPFFNSFLALR